MTLYIVTSKGWIMGVFSIKAVAQAYATTCHGAVEEAPLSDDHAINLLAGKLPFLGAMQMRVTAADRYQDIEWRKP